MNITDEKTYERFAVLQAAAKIFGTDITSLNSKSRLPTCIDIAFEMLDRIKDKQREREPAAKRPGVLPEPTPRKKIDFED